VVNSPLVRLVLPLIRFLFVGSRVCSTLPSDGPSRDLICPCASLALRLHQAVQGTCTPKLLNMPDTLLSRPVGPADGLRMGRPDVAAMAGQDLVLADELAAATHHGNRGAVLEERNRERIDPRRSADEDLRLA
jgi:hypothetical protein